MVRCMEELHLLKFQSQADGEHKMPTGDHREGRINIEMNQETEEPVTAQFFNC